MLNFYLFIFKNRNRHKTLTFCLGLLEPQGFCFFSKYILIKIKLFKGFREHWEHHKCSWRWRLSPTSLALRSYAEEPVCTSHKILPPPPATPSWTWWWRTSTQRGYCQNLRWVTLRTRPQHFSPPATPALTSSSTSSPTLRRRFWSSGWSWPGATTPSPPWNLSVI